MCYWHENALDRAWRTLVMVMCWWVASVLNLIILICYYACSLSYLERLFYFIYQTYFAPKHGGVYLVTIDREFNY